MAMYINRMVRWFDVWLIVKDYNQGEIKYTLLVAGVPNPRHTGTFSIDLDGYDLSTDADHVPTNYDTWAALWHATSEILDLHL